MGSEGTGKTLCVLQELQIWAPGLWGREMMSPRDCMERWAVERVQGAAGHTQRQTRSWGFVVQLLSVLLSPSSIYKISLKVNPWEYLDCFYGLPFNTTQNWNYLKT